MGWEIGFDNHWSRDIGYGVPALCDKPKCTAEIDRGLAYVCGSDPYGGEYGCGLFFCEKHQFVKVMKSGRAVSLCDNCFDGKPPFEPKPDVAEWIIHKLTDKTWQQWRDENAEEVESLRTALTVKILPMWQPFASLAVLGEKEYETRKFGANVGTIIAIYATKKFPPEAKSLAYSNPFYREALGRHFIEYVEQLPFGAIIGSVEVFRLFSTHYIAPSLSEREIAFGDYSPGRKAWQLRNSIELKTPIPFKGHQGTWNSLVPDEIRDAILKSRGI